MMRRAAIFSTVAIATCLALGASPRAQTPEGAVPSGGTEATTPAGASSEPVPEAATMAEWPCVQRKVETLTVTQVWDGPPIDDIKDWGKDPEIAPLVTKLATRRVPMPEAEAAIKKFADKQPADVRDKRLTILFAGLFDTVNNQRKTVVGGIGRYQRSQKERSAELERQGAEIAKLETAAAGAAEDSQPAKDLAVAQEHFDWATRIFQERQQSIPIACELPGLIEERLAALVRAIRQEMKS